MNFAFRVFILLVLSFSAVAQERIDLFRAEMLVTSQSPRERSQATVDGLAEVVVRASGLPEVLENPDVIDALGNADRYLVEWRYETTEETVEDDGREVPAWRLVLRYSGDAVEKLLRDLRLPIWPANRPSVLPWLMVDDASGRNRVTPSSHTEVLEALESAARRRGLPLIKPILDLEDSVALPSEALWSVQEDTIREASERYNPDSILVGRLTETARGEWRASWRLMHRGRSTVFDSRAADLEGAVAAAVDEMAAHFFQMYGIIPQEGSSEALVFQIDDVDDFAGYARLSNYLDNLAVIRRYDLVAVHGSSMLVYVYPTADLDQLQSALALDERLLPYTDLGLAGVPPGSPGNPLRYRWR
ncbi:DUF2066 domain-containing protein [Gilvimarinus sp. F26214L]|uniref:DUF2066 domain-containing protein n=1 Tax=Gilvimarinus sp. DZF01 TaxID=3461371 RepID=UPI0040460E08